jgi:hypothetical protein
MKRVLWGGMKHEVNSFLPGLTDLLTFRQPRLLKAGIPQGAPAPLAV